MNYILRPYQEEAVKAGIDFFNSSSKKNSIIVIPTGGGKSICIASIAKSLNGKVIIFQPSIELLNQNYDKYLSYGEEAEIYSASAGRKQISNIVFATIGSVINKPELFNEFSYCIVDEAHLISPDENTMYKKFFNSLTLKILGLTATPVRNKRYNFPVPHVKANMLNRMRPRFFTDYLHITQIQELKKNGWFADIDYYNFDFNESILQINSSGGDFTEHSIDLALKENSVLKNVHKEYLKICKEGIVKHIIIYTDSLKNASRVRDLIGKDKCGIVTSLMKKEERIETLNKFKNGEIKVVVNCQVLAIGFDFPELDCVMIAKPTMSLGAYYQIIGRVVRPHPNKKKARVYDFVGNYKKFGKVEDFVIEEKDGKWMIHNGVKVLTNVDISGEGRDNVRGITNNIEERNNKELEKLNPILSFGKFKGQKCSETPDWYLKWFYEKIDRNKYNENVFKYIETKQIIKK
jgi:DNA repair protein RadD